jgi:DNA replication protein DnaD
MKRAEQADLTDATGTTPDTKWGSIVTGGRNGYQLVPDVLVRHQHRLGLNCTDMVVLLNILMHWWESERDSLPHPRPAQIARRIGTTARTVQRCIRKLSEKGLIKWLPSERHQSGIAIRRFDLDGLCAHLLALTTVSEFEEKAA